MNYHVEDHKYSYWLERLSLLLNADTTCMYYLLNITYIIAWHNYIRLFEAVHCYGFNQTKTTIRIYLNGTVYFSFPFKMFIFSSSFKHTYLPLILTICKRIMYLIRQKIYQFSGYNNNTIDTPTLVCKLITYKLWAKGDFIEILDSYAQMLHISCNQNIYSLTSKQILP